MLDVVSTPAPASDPLVRAEGIVKHFPIKEGIFFKHQVGSVKAVDGVSLEVRRGETLGLVGETGCGKSTLARCIMRLFPLTAGKLTFDGADLSTLSRSQMRPYRRGMQMIFQDPYGSLNSRRRVGSIIGDPLAIHKIAKGAERKKLVQGFMEVVGLNPEHYNRFPAEFSGGQRQRIGVARALALRPKLIVADEPVSALDVSIQAQIINLLEKLQSEFGLTYLFIAHDLSVVRHISDRIAVMYLGKIVEIAGSRDLYERPLHPYSVALLSAVPIPDPAVEGRRRRIILTGDVPSPSDPPPGCAFHTRCWLRERLGNPERCVAEVPVLREMAARHPVACHFAEEVDGTAEQVQVTGRGTSTGTPLEPQVRGARVRPARRVSEGNGG
jgi:oligopeptide transport system ATP-binding protein